MKRDAFTLIEILVVIAIIGMLSTMIIPKVQNALEISKSKINQATMQDIKRAALEFKNDVGFVPDNVALMIYPYEICDVSDKNYDNDSNTSACKNMIAFVDSRLTLNKYRLNGEGDYGTNMIRDEILIKEIQRRLDIKNGAWRGSYIGGNGHLLNQKIKKLGDGSSETNNEYFLSEKDMDLYYDGVDENENFNAVLGVSDEYKKYYPIYTENFNTDAHDLYDIAKYRKNLKGELSILDPWGTPYEIQFPKNVPTGKSKERYARIVSFGKNRQRDIKVDDNLNDNYSLMKPVVDDSVLYIYDNNLTNYFNMQD
jgi:prepilin-type N-terminal cleavage/methylation domain-containing protein